MRVANKTERRALADRAGLTSDNDVVNYLCCFLNLNVEGKTLAEIFAVVKEPVWKYQWVGPAISGESARSLQREIKEDLRFLFETDKGEDETAKGLSSLISKINNMNLKPEWRLQRYKDYRFLRNYPKKLKKHGKIIDPLPFQKRRRPLVIGKSEWLIERTFLNNDNPRDRLYSLIVDCFENDELGFVKRCPQCLRFHTVNDLGTIFCSSKCRYDFHNDKKDFKELRQKRRKELLSQARMLRKKGIPLYKIKDRTGLGYRILNREFGSLNKRKP